MSCGLILVFKCVCTFQFIFFLVSSCSFFMLPIPIYLTLTWEKTLIMIFVYYVENNNRTEEIDTGIILHNKKDLKLIVRCICILLPFPYFNHHYHHFLCIHSVFQCFNVFNIFEYGDTFHRDPLLIPNFA